MTQSVDELVQQIARTAKRVLRVKQAILFGSWARGDARPDSDIDLAFEHDSTDAEWAEFANAMADHAPTLLRLDLVDIERADPQLRARILLEGRRVHG